MTSHANCTHPATKAARAQCRKDRAAHSDDRDLRLEAAFRHPLFGQAATALFGTTEVTDDQAQEVANLLESDHGLTY